MLEEGPRQDRRGLSEEGTTERIRGEGARTCHVEIQGTVTRAEGEAGAKALRGNVPDGPRAQQAGKAGRSAAWGDAKVGEPVPRGWGESSGNDPDSAVNSGRRTAT